jgi:hypothetical protein
MSEFVQSLMRVAYDVTKAERAFAVDTSLTVLSTINITPDAIEAPYLKCIQQALNSGKAVITDNYTMTIDPSKAPVTNQSFPKLRFVVVLPVLAHGAVCMDQSLRGGVTSKEKVDRLNRFVQHVLANQQTHLSEQELFDLYNSL